MTRFHSMSIRAQLFLVVFLIALPAAGIIMHMGIKLQKEVIDQATLDSHKIVDRIVTEQVSLVTGAEQLMTAIAQLPEVRQQNPAKTLPILSELRKLNPMYSNIFIADRKGDVWVTVVPVPGGFNVADRRYFRNAIATGRMSSGEYLISRATAKPAFNFASPLKDNAGNTIGIISIGIILDRYKDLLGRMKSPSGTNSVLIDHRGMILSRAVNPEKFIGTAYPAGPFKSMESGADEGMSVRAGLVGDKRIISYRKLWLKGEQVPYMYVTAGIPIESVLANANRTLLFNFLLFLSVLILAFLLAWRIGKRSIVDRITLLDRASQQLAQGHHDVRVSEVVAGGELGRLGQTFDTMAHQLSLREQALREREANFREIFNATRDAIFVIDPESEEIIEANRSTEEIFGCTREEMLGKKFHSIGTSEPPYPINETSEWLGNVTTQGPQNFEWRCHRKTGEAFWAEIAITTSDIVGKTRVLAVVRNITERKEVERVKDEMLSAVSHEMRTPLTAMLGFLQFVLENTVDKEQMREYHQIMYRETERLNELISGFLDLQRFRAKQQNLLNRQPLAVMPLLQECLSIFQDPSGKHTIHLDIPQDLPEVMADATSLQQVFRNLLSNAVKFSPGGSDIIIGALPAGNTVTLWVKDEGIGIPPEYLDKIFETFCRVDNTARRVVGGTGLGLSLVREIVMALDGRVWVESTPGKGSTFFVSLPAVNHESEGPGAP